MHGRTWTTRIAVSVAAVAVTSLTAVGAAPATAASAPAAARSATATYAVPTAPAPAAGAHAGLADVDYETWKRDVSAVTDVARPYLEQRISQGSGEKMAIVLDIDNTSLETHFHPLWEYPTPPVQQTLDLARYADSRGVAVYFVTARPGIIYSLTKCNLEKTGFPISGLYVRDLPDLFEEVSKYKTAKRAEIEAKGYKIIANIGNTPTDMVGGHAEKTFKLPDYDGALS
ncbi:HAD family acid phosphatase [Streptomyces sp. NPDC051776]|uniref:HAD family acid phosphatase n=1 Tax=Streptomyces sp. NPDC051776 TaxID=3155414 RepID=UPI00344426B8